MEIDVAISLLAAGISLYTLRRTNKINMKIANKEFDQTLLNDIFSNVIQCDIPKLLLTALKSENDHFIDNVEDVEQQINKIIDQAYIYKYLDEDFYQNLCETLYEINDLVLSTLDTDENIGFDENYEEIKVKLDEVGKKMYNLLVKKFHI